MTPSWFRPESVTWAVDPRRYRDGMIEERSAIGGSSEVEEVECWMGLREAIQRASQALQGQPGIWEALLREAGGVQRRRRRASVAFQMWFRWRCDSDGSLRRAHRERTEILEWSSWLPRYRRRAERIARRHPPGAQSVRLGIRAGSVGRRALRPGQSTGSGAVMRGRSRRSAKFCRAVRIRVHG